MAFKCVFDGTVNRPDLPGRLGLGDGRQSLVGGRGEVLHQDEAFDVIRLRLGEVLTVLNPLTPK